MTIARVASMMPAQGWTGGYATRNDNTGSVYLNCEFVVMEGEFARRKMWSLIGLHSPKGPEWANMGRTFVKAILNSARGIHPGDNSPAAQNARASAASPISMASSSWARSIGRRTRTARTRASSSRRHADHKDYAALMGGAPAAARGAGGPHSQRLCPGHRPRPGAGPPQLGAVREDAHHDAPSPSNPAGRAHPGGARPARQHPGCRADRVGQDHHAVGGRRQVLAEPDAKACILAHRTS
jgi:hypothetical protein